MESMEEVVESLEPGVPVEHHEQQAQQTTRQGSCYASLPCLTCLVVVVVELKTLAGVEPMPLEAPRFVA
jgi:hypothetical protein